MHKFSESTGQDILQLTEWIVMDPYHRDYVNPVWWLTGNGLLSFRVDDDDGPTMYIRTDADSGLLRIHTQFAPEDIVSKTRVIKSIIWGLPRMKSVATENKLSGFIYKSTSPMLIQFMQKKFRFTPVGNDDYRMFFEGDNVRT